MMHAMAPWLNGAAGTLLPLLAAASLAGAIAFLLALGIDLLWPRGPARVRCWIWRLAHLKLLLPLLLIPPISVPLLPAGRSALMERVAIRSGPGPLSVADPRREPEPRGQLPASAPVRRPAEAAAVPAPAPVRLSAGSIALILYFVGVALALVQTVRSWRRVRRLCRKAAPCEDERLLSLSAALASGLRLRASPRLLLAESLYTPMLAGIASPAILLPASILRRLSDEDLRRILTHELAHLKRRDLAWNWLPTLSGILFFFHPLVWIARRELALAQEIACDQLAVDLSHSTVSDYSRTLVEVISLAGRRSRDVFAVGMSTSTLRRRICAMRHFSTRERPLLATGIVALAALAVLPWRLAAESPAPASQPAMTVSHSPDARFHTIQSAIDAAPDNATIHIAAGVYTESLTARHPVILEGEGWDKTVLSVPLLTAAEIAGRLGDTKNLNNGQLQQRYAAILKDLPPAGITIDAPGRVELRNLEVSASPGRRNDSRYSPALVQLQHANVAIDKCAFVGSPGDLLRIQNGTTAEIHHSLFAGSWGTGIIIGDRDGQTVAVTIADCDIRNNYYAGITISTGEKASISRCRISGSAWHGIRYDDASPAIMNCRIFNNARSGIYASGRTMAEIIDNLFLANGMDGISCWFGNSDAITSNTFAGNQREAIAVLGNARPTITRNIFFNSPVGIDCGSIAGAQAAVGAPTVGPNLFWRVPTPERVMPDRSVSLTNAVDADPQFVDAAAGDFVLSAASPGDQNFGCPHPLPAASPFPLQPQEKAIIPTSESRDYKLWQPPLP